MNMESEWKKRKNRRWSTAVITAAAIVAVAGGVHFSTTQSYAAEPDPQQNEQTEEPTDQNPETPQPGDNNGQTNPASEDVDSTDQQGSGADTVNPADGQQPETPQNPNNENNGETDGEQQDTFTGVRQDAATGKLFYYVNGKQDTTFTGIYHDTATSVHYYIVAGIVDDSFTGLAADVQGNAYYFSSGVQDKTFTGLVQDNGVYHNVADGADQGPANGLYDANVNGTSAKWYFKDGTVATDVSGIVSFEGTKNYIQAGKVSEVTDVIYTSDVNSPNVNNWYNIVDGVVKPGPTVSHNVHGWWYINQDGIVDFNYNGFAENQNGTWYLTGGQVHFGITDVKLIDGKWYNLDNSKLIAGPTVAHNSNGWWYINKDGYVDFNYKGIASNRYGTWYLTNGKVHFSTTDVKLINGKWYNLVDDKLTVGPTVAHNSNGWWYINKDGYVDFNYNGIASNRYGTWYLTNGKVHFSTTDVKLINGKWYNLVGDKLTAGPTVAHNSNGWWYINPSGVVDFNYNGVASNRYGTWYLSGGKVHFNVTDVKYTNGKWYNLVGSKVAVGPTVAHNSYGWWYINGSGIVDFAARTGWFKSGGTWFYFNRSSKASQIQNSAPTLTYIPGYYVSPMKTGNLNSSQERIEAMIARAYEYMGTRYQVCKSTAPGGAADCSGLVMQCLYAAGFNPYPATPAHHALPQNEYDSRTIFYQVSMPHISVNQIRRGDLVWYAKRGTIIHIAIYLGNGQVIDAWPPRTTTHSLHWSHYGYIYGVGRPFP